MENDRNRIFSNRMRHKGKFIMSPPIPKKKWSEPVKSTTMKPEMPEYYLQAFADDYIYWKKYKNIRIPDSFFRWIKMNAPARVQKWFFWLFGGFPDNLILIPMGKYMLAIPMELKTQDAQGRAVGALHGKQKHNARDEHWLIARSTDQIQNIVDDAEKAMKEIMNMQGQNPQPAMCLGCEYWKLPSQGHCMRGEGVEFCFKSGTHAGVR
jgi:hypothetical protein